MTVASAMEIDANKVCRVCGVRIGSDRPHFHVAKGGPGALIHEECAEFEARTPVAPDAPEPRDPPGWEGGFADNH